MVELGSGRNVSVAAAPEVLFSTKELVPLNPVPGPLVWKVTVAALDLAAIIKRASPVVVIV